jgi:hypothetical protein
MQGWISLANPEWMIDHSTYQLGNYASLLIEHMSLRLFAKVVAVHQTEK